MRSLPFGVDDYEEVNRIYRRWTEERNVDDHRHIDIWTYCFVQRYFAIQFLRSDSWLRSDADRLVDTTLRRIRSARYQLRNPDRYTSWVASTCRNAHLTHIRTNRLGWLVDPDTIVAEPTVGSHYDVGAMFGALESGIERLPAFLRPAARMRLLEGMPYREIAKLTGQSVPTLRSYANRAIAALRKDPAVRSVFDELRPD